MSCDLLLLDAKYLLYKGAFAFKDLGAIIKGKATPTGAVYGMLKQVLRIHDTYGGEVILAWDGVTNFRRGLYPDYKKPKKPMDKHQKQLLSDVHIQEPITIELLSSMGIRQAYAESYEADDIMHTLGQHFGSKGYKVYIYTGDEDLLQSVSENCHVVLSKRKINDIMVDEKALMDLKGLTAEQFADAKCLSGCNSDQVPGVPGVGPKYATKVIQAFGDLDTVVANLEVESDAWNGVPKRIHAAIVEFKDRVMGNTKLIRLADCSDHLKFFPNTRDEKHAQFLMRQLDFKSLLKPETFEMLMRMGTPSNPEFICPRGNQRYQADKLVQMCVFYLNRKPDPKLANKYCQEECEVPDQLGIQKVDHSKQEKQEKDDS